MKRLYILRHALTAPAGDGGDRERKLTTQGLQDARNLGVTMRDKNFQPDFIVCSPVTRTRQTLDQVVESLGKIQTEFPKSIYEGGYSDLLALVRATDDQFSSLLVVGHNPAIHQFAASLSHEDGSADLNKLATGYAPGTLTVLDVPRARWADLTPAENKLVELLEP